MKPVDATPPADFPKLVVVLDREFARRHPDKGFYLRVVQDNGIVDVVELQGELTLPGAVQLARSKGYEPTHWMESTAGFPETLPSGMA